MFLIVGLGNPGKQYEHTRHNIGFDVMDALAEKYNISISEKKHKALCGKGVINGVKVVLAKPQTYMNLSGESVAELVNYYKMDPEEEMIVIYDDISLAPGNLRIRKKDRAVFFSCGPTSGGGGCGPGFCCLCRFCFGHRALSGLWMLPA